MKLKLLTDQSTLTLDRKVEGTIAQLADVKDVQMNKNNLAGSKRVQVIVIYKDDTQEKFTCSREISELVRSHDIKLPHLKHLPIVERKSEKDGLYYSLEKPEGSLTNFSVAEAWKKDIGTWQPVPVDVDIKDLVAL